MWGELEKVLFIYLLQKNNTRDFYTAIVLEYGIHRFYLELLYIFFFVSIF
jgi:hypothetical protein